MSRIEDYKAAAKAGKEAQGSDAKAWDKAGETYLGLTRSDCAELWPGSPESKDPSRRP